VVEAYGHVNYGWDLYDPKGIIGNVYINNNVFNGNVDH
jgi:beta-galactosidase